MAQSPRWCLQIAVGSTVQKLKDNQFIMILDKEKQNILIFERLEAATFLYFCLLNHLID